MLSTALCRSFAAALVVSLACSQAAPREPTSADGSVTAELQRIFEADQNEPYPQGEPADSAARVAFFTAHWTRYYKRRHDRVVEIASRGLLTSAEDYFMAGMILNHGIAAEDNLVAHALFTVAALKGHPEARWGSAAALDNFLATTGHAQLFGTVYGDGRQVMGAPMTDALRAQFCVPPVAKQQILVEHLRRGRSGAFDREKVACADTL